MSEDLYRELFHSYLEGNVREVFNGPVPPEDVFLVLYKTLYDYAVEYADYLINKIDTSKNKIQLLLLKEAIEKQKKLEAFTAQEIKLEDGIDHQKLMRQLHELVNSWEQDDEEI